MMFRHSSIRLMLVILLSPLPASFLLVSTLHAQTSESLLVKGFVSQGYLNTADNNYLVPNSVDGTAEFNEAAIIVSAQPMDKLRVGIQLLARNFGDIGNGVVMVDWAYGDYRLYDQLGFRLGKVKLPMGFYNEGRDVDMLRTTVFLPQSVYDESRRDFILAYEGGGLYGNLDLGSGGDLDYQVFGGTLNVPDPTVGTWKRLFGGGGLGVEADIGEAVDEELGNPAGTAEVSFQGVDDPLIDFPYLYGGSLVWNLPVNGLRIGATNLQGQFHYQGTFKFDVFVPAGNNEPGYRPFNIDVDNTQEIKSISTLSGEYSVNDLTLTAEYLTEKIESEEYMGWYAQADYRFSRLFSMAAYYAYGSGNESSKEEIIEAGLPEYYNWQQDWTIATRFDLTDFWLFKLEYHFIEGVAVAEYSGDLAAEVADPMDRHWGMLTAKTTFHF